MGGDPESVLRGSRRVIAVDTNILVYAHRRENPHYAVASRRIGGLASGGAAWGIPWPCVHEFLSIVTRPRVFDPPTPLNNAIAQVEIWMESPTNSLLAEADGYWSVLRRLVEARVGHGHGKETEIGL